MNEYVEGGIRVKGAMGGEEEFFAEAGAEHLEKGQGKPHLAPPPAPLWASVTQGGLKSDR